MRLLHPKRAAAGLLLLSMQLLCSSCERDEGGAKHARPEAAGAESGTPAIAWMRNISEAKGKAAAEKKDLFLYFTVSDGWPACKRFEAEVLAQPEVVSATRSKYVFLYLDFPSGDVAKFDVHDSQANEELRARYKISTYPTVLLARPDGTPIGVAQGMAALGTAALGKAAPGESAAGPGGVKQFLAQLADLAARGSKLKHLLDHLPDAKPDEITNEALLEGLVLLEEIELLDDVSYAGVIKLARARTSNGADNGAGTGAGTGSIGGSGDDDPEVAARVREFLLVLDENNAITKLYANAANGVPPYEELLVVIHDSPHARGNALIKPALECFEWLDKRERYAEAKAVLERLLADPAVRANEKRTEEMRRWIERCDRKLADKKAH